MLAEPTGMPEIQAETPNKVRSRSGCAACRRTRIKCDEIHPACGRCTSKGLECEWPRREGGPSRRHRNPRSVSSCESCRQRKIRCRGSVGSICDSCQLRGLACRWIQRGSGTPSSGERLSTSPTGIVRPAYTFTTFGQVSPDFTISAPPPPPPLPPPAHAPVTLGITQPSPAGLPLLIDPSELSEIKEQVRVYFSTVHHFGYLSFVHEADYWERFEQGRAPETLTLLMAANALRFGSFTSFTREEDLAKADRWASRAGDRMLSLIANEFGAIELMEVVLCHHYDFLCGRYQRGWIMAGMAVRMMTFLRLHTLDESPPPTFKPLLSVESLRRLAWAVWFLDATIDGGNFGFSTIGDGALTIQLPCDNRPFILHQQVTTEPLDPSKGTGPSVSSGLSAHLLRAMSARQIPADLYSRIKRNLVDPAKLETLVPQAEANARRLLDALPAELAYSRTQYHAYKDQLPMLVSIHMMRNTCLRHIALLRILAAPHLVDGLQDIPRQRETMIQDAKQLSNILADALHFGVNLEPQAAMHAYNGIEVLLFQPMRQSLERSDVTLTRQEVLGLLRPLMQVLRSLSQVCALVDLIYPEAINRMVRLGYVDDLTNEDVVAVLKKIHCLANADSEFDFNESFWRYELSLSRQRGVENTAESPTDALLELRSDTSPTARPVNSETTIEDPITRLQSLFPLSSRPTPNAAVPSMNANETTGLLQEDSLFSLPFEDLQTMLNTYTSPDPAPFPFSWSFSDGSRHI